MRLVYYFRHMDPPIGAGAHAASLVREWKQTGNHVLCLPNPSFRDGALAGAAATAGVKISKHLKEKDNAPEEEKS